MASPQSWRRALSALLALAATGAVAWLAWTLARLVWLMLAGAGHEVVIRSHTTGQPGAAGTVLDYAVLERVTPFRSDASPGAHASGPPPEDTPETDLDLELFGITVRTSDGAGLAKISTDGGSQKSYGLGDEVSPGVLIERIYADGVLLRREGQLERLPLKVKSSGERIVTIGGAPITEPGVGTVPPSQVRTRGSNGAADRSASVPEPRPSADLAATELNMQLTRSEALTVAQSIVTDPSIGDVDYGIAIFPTRNRELISQAGLEAGDVIQQIDGVRVDRTQDLQRLFADLEGRTRLRISLVRPGEGARLLTITLVEDQ